MKSISKILVAIAVLLSINSYSQLSKVEIVATGLTCSMCSNAINKQLKKLPEVDNIDIDLNTNTFTVTLKKGNQITPRILKETIQKAGFFVGSMVISFENQPTSKNYIFINDKKSIRFKIIDKGYMPMKAFKKMQKIYAKIPTYLVDNEVDYHLIAVE